MRAAKPRKPKLPPSVALRQRATGPAHAAAIRNPSHPFSPLPNGVRCLCGHEADHPNHKCPRCGQRLDPRFAACSCVEPNADPMSGALDSVPGHRPPGVGLPPPRGSFRTFDQLAAVPISKWTDEETRRYVAFVFESAAHLQGGFGSLTARHCLALATRVGQVGLAAEHMLGRVGSELRDPDRASVKSVNAALDLLTAWGNTHG